MKDNGTLAMRPQNRMQLAKDYKMKLLKSLEHGKAPKEKLSKSKATTKKAAKKKASKKRA